MSTNNTTTNTAAITARPWLLNLLGAILLAACLVLWWGLSLHAKAIDQLHADVAALKAGQPEEELLEGEPDPVPARPTAPRAALRPAAPQQAPNPGQPPVPAPLARWGTTDLDRAIAAHPPVLNQLETMK